MNKKISCMTCRFSIFNGWHDYPFDCEGCQDVIEGEEVRRNWQPVRDDTSCRSCDAVEFDGKIKITRAENMERCDSCALNPFHKNNWRKRREEDK